jgi:hypothetical protein
LGRRADSAVATDALVGVGLYDELMGAVERIGVWLHERSGAPDGPSPRLLAAWAVADWPAVITECETWLGGLEILLSANDTPEERQRIVNDACGPIMAVQAVAHEMTASADHRRERKVHRTVGMLRELELAVTTPETEAGFGFQAEQIATVFEHAALFDIDLSRSPEQQQ